MEEVQSVMFHHFHGNKHLPQQGSISGEELRQMINALGPQTILSAEKWLSKARDGTLKPDDRCLTFDDGLLCQYDVAVPILKEFNLTAFWFVYTSPFEGIPEKLEIFRAFRHFWFNSVEEFYNSFDDELSRSDISKEVEEALRTFDVKSYLKESAFYTDGDRKFRFLRDQVLGPTRYNTIMDAMLETKKVDVASLSQRLWMTKEQLRSLADDGHVIGLHTHTHPTCVAKMDEPEQWEEYNKNYGLLSSIIGKPPITMAHPCGSYNDSTFKVLDKLGIVLGFRANNIKLPNPNQFEFRREDHANIIKLISVGA